MTTVSDRRVAPHEIAHLYGQHQRDLQRAVAAVVRAPRELIEDACQSAWTTLLRSRPRRATWFAWLRVVAIHEAYRLCDAHRDARLEALAHSEGWDSVIAGHVTLDDTIEARRALRLLADLPARQREDLSLLVAGFTYAEIQQLTGGRTYTNVDKHLKKARARIRLAELRDAGAKSRRRASS